MRRGPHRIGAWDDGELQYLVSYATLPEEGLLASPYELPVEGRRVWADFGEGR